MIMMLLSADEVRILREASAPDASSRPRSGEDWRRRFANDLTLNQIHDLTFTAIDADNWHAVRILRDAALPDERGREPTDAELALRELAREAWNSRAVRLRVASRQLKAPT